MPTYDGKTNPYPEVKQPREIKAVYLHEGEYFITTLFGSITLAYQPMTVRKGAWPAIAFNSPEMCRKLGQQLIEYADKAEARTNKVASKVKSDE